MLGRLPPKKSKTWFHLRQQLEPLDVRWPHDAEVPVVMGCDLPFPKPLGRYDKLPLHARGLARRAKDRTVCLGGSSERPSQCGNPQVATGFKSLSGLLS